MSKNEVKNESKESLNRFHYDAFISYRHCQPDQFVAENLHKQLESFKLPANIVKKMKAEGRVEKTKITRVFRDQEELPLATNLEDPIVDALKNSEWLIVICSPRLKESMWCKKEIETFIKLHGRDRVMAVLVEGEPVDSFPDELLHRDVEVVRADGTKEIVSEPTEPLAADIRADNNKDRVKALKAEIVRLLAPMFNLGYDELKQRHRERKIKNMVTLASIIAVVCFLFGVLGVVSALTINGQKNEIVKQKDEIEAKSLEIEEQAAEISSQYEALKINQAQSLADKAIELSNNDDRAGAIELACQALTEYEGNKMPYTDEARFALMTALKPYELTDAHKALYQIETRGVIDSIKMSPSRKVLMLHDSSDTLTFWNVEEGCFIRELMLEFGYLDSNFIFKDDENLICADGGSIYEINVFSGEKTTIKEGELFDFIDRVRYDYSTNKLYYLLGKTFYGLDSSYNECFEYTVPEDEYASSDFRYLIDSNVAIVSTTKSEDTYNDNTVIRIVNEDEEVLFEKTFDNENYENSYQRDDDFFVVTNRFNKQNGFLSGSSSIIRSYDINSGKLNWEAVEDNLYIDKLAVISESDGPCVVGIGTYGVVEVEVSTGDKKLVYRDEGDIVWSGAVDTAVVYFNDNATKSYVTNYSTMGYGAEIQCNLDTIALFEMAPEGYFIAPKNSNRIVYYTLIGSEDMTEYDGTYDLPETTVLNEFTDNDEVRNLDLPDLDMIRQVAFDDKEEYACVTYKDLTAKLYRLDDSEEVASWKLTNGTDKMNYYLGKDNEGNSYWASDYYGYCISKDNKLIGKFDYLRYVDAKNNKYVFGFVDGEKYCAPIYSVDDLLKMAEK